MSIPEDSESDPSSLYRLICSSPSCCTGRVIAAATIISLLLGILFVLFLHIYTRWFLLARSIILRPRPRHRFANMEPPDHDSRNSPCRHGLPLQTIKSLPLFVYKVSSNENLDCSICLSAFEDEEIGRKLPGCGHAFHMECIDKWLRSHSTCPICRAAAIQCDDSRKIEQSDIETANPDHQSDGATNGHVEVRLEIVTSASDHQISQRHQTDEIVAENDEAGVGV